MRKLYKICNLSTAYKTWVDAFEAAEMNHEAYNSSNNQYYLDIVMNLFHCQMGLCAYTEVLLCEPALYDKTRWTQQGIYDRTNGKPPTEGQLEHFDRTIKTTKAWLWENFFMVLTDVNIKVKLVKGVPIKLKPDLANYDEFTLLDYDLEKNIFIPNPNLSHDDQQIVQNDLLILGVNWGPIIEKRRIFLKDKISMINFGVFQWNDIEIEQFPTAIEFYRRKIQV